MKPVYIFFLIFLTCCSCSDCDTDCIADVAVISTSFNTTTSSSIANGTPIEIEYTIKNVINTLEGCSVSGNGKIMVLYGYNEFFEPDFNDYEVFETITIDTESFDTGEGQEGILIMLTNQGPGIYAMKMEVKYENDTTDSNNVGIIMVEVE